MKRAHSGNHRQIAFVLAVMGRYHEVESPLAATVHHLQHGLASLDAALVVAFEDPRWLATPLAQTLRLRFPPDCVRTFCGSKPDIPAVLFNEAASRVQADHVVFLWPGCLPQFEAVCKASRRMNQANVDWLAYVEPRITEQLGVQPAGIDGKFLAYFLSCGRLFSLGQVVVKRDSFLRLGGFDSTPLLQRDFDLEFLLRSAHDDQRVALEPGHLVKALWDWSHFPLNHDFRVPRHVARSYRLRTAGRHTPADGRGKVLRGLMLDLPPAPARRVARLTDAGASEPLAETPSAPYRLAVTGGIWEYAHNRLCFFNHLEHLESSGVFSYVRLLDELLKPEEDLCGVDAVIVSRGRHPNVLKTLDYCKQRGIPTIYMIDDNWLWLGRDRPDPYARIFSPGLPQFETFLTCLRECDAVLVYNDLLAADVGKYARSVLRVPLNIRADHFRAPLKHAELRAKVGALIEWRRRSGGLILGYAGSFRYGNSAFRALAEAARSRKHTCRVILFGYVTAEQQEMFDHTAVVLPYVSYHNYTAALGMLKPDILVAPLDSCHSSMSKCPNKYLDYAMAGAAGVYRGIPPYSQVVTDGVNGVLVSRDDQAAWRTAILGLVDSPTLRQSIAAAANRDVVARYETGVVAPVFADAVIGVIRAKRGQPCPPQQPTPEPSLLR